MNEELRKRIAYLESMNDHLITELNHVDKLMQMVGFDGGLEALKATAQHLRDQGHPDFDPSNIE